MAESLISEYTAFEKEIPVSNGDPKLWTLPHFNGNKTLPIHRWFTYKEGFSAQLLDWICTTYSLNLEGIQAILDPFCGVGTSLISAQTAYRGKNQLRLKGIERNPFIAFVAATKLAWKVYDVRLIAKRIPIVIQAIRSAPISTSIQKPDLSTFHKREFFNPALLERLMVAKEIIDQTLCDAPERAFFDLGWASIIEDVSNLRKDGRALRHVDKGRHSSVYKILELKLNDMLDDLRIVQSNLAELGDFSFEIINGDGRVLEGIEREGSGFDLVVYSPPYLNNIDYSEVYKLELWLSGMIKNAKEFRELRLSTFRSHPSVKFPPTEALSSLPPTTWPRRLTFQIAEAIPKNKDFQWRKRLLYNYADDIFVSLRHQYDILSKGGLAVCVVGNSLHGNSNANFCVATDLIISSIARELGFEIVDLKVARYLNRRASAHYSDLLRESIIVLRK